MIGLLIVLVILSAAQLVALIMLVRKLGQPTMTPEEVQQLTNRIQQVGERLDKAAKS